jgi:hypothetical protein
MCIQIGEINMWRRMWSSYINYDSNVGQCMHPTKPFKTKKFIFIKYILAPANISK